MNGISDAIKQIVEAIVEDRKNSKHHLTVIADRFESQEAIITQLHKDNEELKKAVAELILIHGAPNANK